MTIIIKTALIITLSLFISQLSFAQNNSIYVSKQGGESHLLNFGQLGYNSFHYNSCSDNCDSLICSGKGLLTCKLSYSIIREAKNKENLKIFNKAIFATVKHLKKEQLQNGKLDLNIKNKKVSVNFYRADQYGNADFLVKILS